MYSTLQLSSPSLWLLMGLIPMMACSGEKVLTNTTNSPPTITIMSHGDGFEVQEGYSEAFRASVADEDNGYEDLEVAWYVGDELVCDWTTASAAGESFCDVVFDIEDTSIVAQVRDNRDGAARAELSCTVLATEVPEVEIEAPVTNGRFYSDQLITFRAVASDAEDDVRDLSTSWSSNLDGDLGIDGNPDSNGMVEDAATLQQGDHFVEVTVTDTTGKSSTDSVTITVQGPNNVPTCSIESPLTGDVSILGASVVFEGLATDLDIPSTDLSFEWTSDKDGLLGTGAINSDGEISFAYQNLTVNTHTISLIVEDEVGAACSDTILLTVDTPPTIVVQSPTTGDVVTVGQSQVFSATVSDNEDPASALTVEWMDNVDGLIYTGSPDSTGLLEFFDTLSAGNHNLTVTVRDTSGLTATASRSFLVNTEPVVDSLSLQPSIPYVSDTLTATAAFSDAEGHPVTAVYTWYQNSVLTSYTGTTLTSGTAAKHEVWTVRVTPNDGYMDGSFAEASVTILNSVPQISSVSVSPSLPLGNDVLTCSVVATDADGETLTESFAWENVTTGQFLGNGQTLDLGSQTLVGNDEVRCTVTVVDGDSANDTSSTSVIVQNTPPQVSNVAISPQNPLNDQTVSCSATVVDPENDPVTTTFEWQDATGNVLGVGSSLDLSQTGIMPSEVLECIVSSVDTSNALGTGQTMVTVANRSPVLTQSAISPSTAYNDSILTCSAVLTDLDGQSTSLAYTWQDSVGTTLTNTNTLDLTTLTGVQPSDVFTCIVTGNDGVVTVNDTVTTTLDNRLPTVGNISISPNPASIGDILVCSASTATDPDGGSVNLNYEWALGGVVVGTGTTLSTTLSRGDVVSCTVTPDDANGAQWGQGPAISTSITIGNTPPQITSLTLSPNTVDVTTPVVASALTTDLDGDAVTVSYVWTVSGQIVQGVSGDTLDGTHFVRGDSISVEAIPNDGFDDGASVIASIAQPVQNTAPTTPIVAITPSGAVEGDGLICDISTVSTDPDGDSIVYNITWTAQGSAYTGSVLTTNFAGDTIPSGATLQGEVWECTAAAFDGLVLSGTSTDSVTIQSPFNGTGNWSTSTITNPNPSVYLTGLMDIDNYRVLTYGGQSYYQLLGELHSFDLATEVWSTISPTGVYPAALMASAGAFDTATSQFFLFGGQSYYTLLDEMYVLDTTLGAENWDMWTGTTAPEPRRGHSMVFDDLNNDLYVFGGEGYYGLYDDTWMLDLDVATSTTASWVSLSPTGLAPTRMGMAAALDPDYGVVYAFGGQEYYALAETVACYDILNQSWSDATLIGDTLPPMTEASVSWNSRFNGFLVVGGQQYYQLNPSIYAVIPTGSCTAEVTEVSLTSGTNTPFKGGLLLDVPVDQSMISFGGESYYQLSDWLSVFSL